MSRGPVPLPPFDGLRYERPNKNWACGHACDGQPCRIGPSPSGQCRATTECTPRLAVKTGETKGTWTCTRPQDWGGPCAQGPLPDGTCCMTIPPCQPVRTLRARRGLVVRATLAACAGVLLIGLSGSFRETFINPAPLSLHHSGRKFERLAEQAGGGQGCVLCHAEATAPLADLAASAVRAAEASLSFANLTSAGPRDFSRMDRACLECHQAQSFHQASVAKETSCSVCHTEHQGAGRLPPVAEKHCTDCHGDREQMREAAQMARTLPGELFAKPVAAGLVAHPATRPAGGFTQTVTGFAEGHPEFQIIRTGETDTNPLKFNHRLHLTGATIPPVNGRPLECASCHVPDASGAFMQKISFEKNCRSCHALNFDEHNPGMTLPHGDPVFTRAYLRSLPVQYADHAASVLGMKSAEEIAAYVGAQIHRLRETARTGEDLEHAVFFSDEKTGPAPRIAGLRGEARARFAGCATCHTVTPVDNATPLIEPPRTPDRWLVHARFNHAAHTAVACADCHDAKASERTADILLPSQKSCVQCHSPKGGVTSSCSTCHQYHNPPPGQLPGGLRP